MRFERVVYGRRLSRGFVDRVVRYLVRQVVRRRFNFGRNAKWAFYRVFSREPDLVLKLAGWRCPVCGFVGRGASSMYQHVVRSADCSAYIFGAVRDALEDDFSIPWLVGLVFPSDFIYYYIQPCLLSRLYGFYFDFMCSDVVYLNSYDVVRGVALYRFNVGEYVSFIRGRVADVLGGDRLYVALRLVSKIYGFRVDRLARGDWMGYLVVLSRHDPMVYVVLRGALGGGRVGGGAGGFQEG